MNEEFFTYSEGLRIFAVALVIGLCIGWVLSDLYIVKQLKSEVADHSLYIGTNNIIKTKDYIEAKQVCEMLSGEHCCIACDGSYSICTKVLIRDD